MTDTPLWKNTTPSSPLTLHKQGFEHKSVDLDVPGDVLTRLPPNVKDLHATPQGWLGRRGDSYDQLIWSALGKRWSRASFPTPITIISNHALVLSGAPRATIWSVDLTTDDALDGLFDVEAPHQTDMSVRAAQRMVQPDGQTRLILLLNPDILLLVRHDKEDDRWVAESCWHLPSPNTPYNHSYDGLRVVNNVAHNEELLLISETVWSDEPPLEHSQVMALTLRGGTPHIVAHWQPVPGHKEDEYGRFADIDTRHIGPYEGPMYDRNRFTLRVLPDPWIMLDLDPVKLGGLDTLPENLSGFTPLTQATPPILKPTSETPTIQVVEVSAPKVPAPQLDTLEPLTQRLIEMMSAHRPRQTPNAQVLDLLGITMPPDLYAFLHTWAHQHIRVDFEHIDWWVNVQPKLTTFDVVRGDAPHAITIGTTGGGQPYAARIYDVAWAEYVAIDDEGYTFLTAHTFEHFLRELVHIERRQYPINATEFDDLM